MKRKEPRHIWHLSLGFPLTAHQFLFKRKEKKKEPKVKNFFFRKKYSQSLVHSSNETNIELVQCVGTHYNKSKVHCSMFMTNCAVLEGSLVEVQLFMDDLKPIRRQYLYSMFIWSTVSYYFRYVILPIRTTYSIVLYLYCTTHNNGYYTILIRPYVCTVCTVQYSILPYALYR